jgi:hypothetical protein
MNVDQNPHFISFPFYKQSENATYWIFEIQKEIENTNCAESPPPPEGKLRHVLSLYKIKTGSSRKSRVHWFVHQSTLSRTILSPQTVKPKNYSLSFNRYRHGSGYLVSTLLRLCFVLARYVFPLSITCRVGSRTRAAQNNKWWCIDNKSERSFDVPVVDRSQEIWQMWLEDRSALSLWMYMQVSLIHTSVSRALSTKNQWACGHCP